MLKRLLFLLRLFVRQNVSKLKNYYKLTILPNYYSDVADFEDYPNQILIKDTDNLYIYKKSLESTSYSLNKRVILDNNLPYFFRNNLIDDQIYLAQNVDGNLDSSLKISDIWNEDHYNPGEIVDGERDISGKGYTLYGYSNSNNIKIIRNTGKNSRIIGYKVEKNSDPKYTTLLDLNKNE